MGSLFKKRKIESDYQDALIKSDNFTLAKMTCIFLEARCNRVTIAPHFVKNTGHFFSV